MTISKELFLAMLSMDSYNRGYDAGLSDGGQGGLDGLGGAGSVIGNATVLNIPLPTGSKDAGFYAVAYELTEAVGDMPAGTVIISYRGTDDPLGEKSASDIWNGWTGALGVQTSQFDLALDFYNSVLAQPGVTSANTVLTGHSLGGGLAGFVSTLTGTEGISFDHRTQSIQ